MVSKRIIQTFFFGKVSKNILFFKRVKISNLINFKIKKPAIGTRHQTLLGSLNTLSKFKGLRKLITYFKLYRSVPFYQTKVYFIKYNN